MGGWEDIPGSAWKSMWCWYGIQVFAYARHALLAQDLDPWFQTASDFIIWKIYMQRIVESIFFPE